MLRLTSLAKRAPRVLRGIVGPLADLSRAEKCVLFAVAVVHVIGIGWGLPSSDGWDVDGVAPRDFLPGVMMTFSPGSYFTYPPLHLLLLSVLTLPVTLWALVKAPSFSQHDVVTTFLAVPVMTKLSYVARFVSLFMSLGIVLAIGNIAAATFGKRARVWAMLIAGVEVAGTYYAHTSNLDVPALFWASLALLALVRAVQSDEPKKLRRVAILAACAIATKDQAYANFAITLPVVIAWWALLRRDRLRELVKETVMAAVVGLVLVLLFDGALFNPTGFLARVRFLTGPASQDFAQYSHDRTGQLAALSDAATFLPHHYPVAFAPLFAIGFLVALFTTRGRERVAALVPALAIVSFTLAFNCVARRVEERFMMPQMQLLAVYGGGAIGFVLDRASGVTGRTTRLVLQGSVVLGGGVLVLLGLHLSAIVLANMLGDARYDAEAFLREHTKPGEPVETYGSNVYLPRFPSWLAVTRVSPGSAPSRNPMPDLGEREDDLGNVRDRHPKWIVVSTGFAWRFLRSEGDDSNARPIPESQRASLRDRDATTYMHALFESRAGYRVAHISHYEGTRLLPPHPLHASLACDVWIFEEQ